MLKKAPPRPTYLTETGIIYSFERAEWGLYFRPMPLGLVIKWFMLTQPRDQGHFNHDQVVIRLAHNYILPY